MFKIKLYKLIEVTEKKIFQVIELEIQFKSLHYGEILKMFERNFYKIKLI